MAMISNKGAACCALGIALIVGAPAHAKRTSARYTSLTVFGDSLVDAGNYLADPATNVSEPRADLGYFQGRWTNGYDYTDLLSISLFGAPTQASYLGGQNYAYGAARILDTTPAIPNLPDQYATYLGKGQPVDTNGLYVLNYGANDIFNAATTVGSGAYPSADALMRAAANNYAGFVQTLNNAGVRNILITDFPVNNALATAGNAYLTDALAGLSLNADTTVFRFDYLGAFGRIQASPQSYGIAPFTQTVSCRAAGAAAIAAGCVGYFSFDGTHPVAAVQQALYQELTRQFDLAGALPEVGTWAMMIVGLGAVGATLRHQRRITTRVVFA